MSIKNIKVISRNPDHYMRDTKHDLFRVQRNYDPDLHPFHAAREYKEAINAAKLERVFAKPFIGSLTHSESVSSMSRHSNKLSYVFTGTVEGELHMWNLQSRKSMWKVQAHDGQVHSISVVPDGESFFTVGNDKTIKQWSVDATKDPDNDMPHSTWFSETLVTGITHHRSSGEFVTCGERVFLWDINSKSPKSSFDWGSSKNPGEATIACVKFNQTEKNLFASSDFANNIILYDTRSKAISKIKMKLRVNALEWNPMEAFIFTAASEDYNCYSFDIRKMDSADRVIGIHKGHTAAVLDLSYAPTGKEFCTGGYDKSIRIFRVEDGHSRDVYHAKRMYRIGCVLWSGDNNYILSGSSDHNVRLWKANASEKMGIMRRRERTAIENANELKNRYKNFPEVKRIIRHRHLPKHLYHSKQEMVQINNKIKRKEANVRKHSKPGSVPIVSARERPVVEERDEDPQQMESEEHLDDVDDDDDEMNS